MCAATRNSTGPAYITTDAMSCSERLGHDGVDDDDAARRAAEAAILERHELARRAAPAPAWRTSRTRSPARRDSAGAASAARSTSRTAGPAPIRGGASPSTGDSASVATIHGCERSAIVSSLGTGSSKPAAPASMRCSSLVSKRSSSARRPPVPASTSARRNVAAAARSGASASADSSARRPRSADDVSPLSPASA